MGLSMPFAGPKAKKAKTEVSPKEPARSSPDSTTKGEGSGQVKGAESKVKAKESGGKGGGSQYEPAATKYHPLEDACWKRGEK